MIAFFKSNYSLQKAKKKNPTVQISPVFVNVSGLSSVEILSPYNELPWPLCNMTCSKIHVDFTNYTPTATNEYNALFPGKHAPIKGKYNAFLSIFFIFQDFPTLVFSRHSVS